MGDTIVTDITQIEEAILGEIVARIEEVRKTARRKDAGFIFTNPAVLVAVYETDEFIPVGQKSYRVPCKVNILVTFSNAKDEDARRKGINPLVMGIVQALMLKKLGLRLTDPGLVPKRWREVSTDKDFNENKVVYLIEMACSFTIEKPIEDAETDLLTIGLNYFLKPGDDVADAADTITVGP